MENGSLLGVLALFTIGSALVAGIAYFAYFLKDPKNRASAYGAFVSNVKSASTDRRERAGTHADGLAPIKQRLDHSVASAHPDDPARVIPAR